MSDRFFEELEEEIAFGEPRPRASRPAPTAERPRQQDRPARAENRQEPRSNERRNDGPSADRPTGNAPRREVRGSRPRRETPAVDAAPAVFDDSFPVERPRASVADRPTGRSEPQTDSSSESSANAESRPGHRRNRRRNRSGGARSENRLVPGLPSSRGVFIPPQRPGTTRTIALSDTEHVPYPMYLVRHEDRSYLVNSGLDAGSMEFPGIQTVMPDIRILLPLKETIRAWFLTECRPQDIEGILPMIVHLDFPPVYAYAPVAEFFRGLLEKHGLADRLNITVIRPGFENAVTVDELTFRSFAICARENHRANSVLVETPNARIIMLDPEADPALVSEHFGPADLVFTGPADRLTDAMRDRIRLIKTQRCVSIDPHETFDRNPALSLRPQDQFIALQHGNIVDVTEHARIDVHAVRLYLDTLVADATSIGTATSHVVQARGQMQNAGVAVVVFPVDRRSRSIIAPVRIETRGLAHTHEVRDVHRSILQTSRRVYEETIRDVPDIEERDLSKILKKDLEKALQGRFKRSPMIIPVIMTF